MFSNLKACIFKSALAFLFLYCLLWLTEINGIFEATRELQWCQGNLATLHSRQNVDPPLSEPIEDIDGFVEFTEATILDRVRKITKCLDRPMEPIIEQKGDYWVLYNYIRAEKRFRCHESITYTTQGDYSFLDNVIPVLERWRGPISVAIHAPGTDFKSAFDSIAYLRDCTDSMVKEFVTFHIFFSAQHIPDEVPHPDEVLTDSYNCSMVPPFLYVTFEETYKTQHDLLYPVNVGRNVAREMAQTHYVLATDIELYPTPNLIPQFLAMIADNTDPLLSKDPKVFPLHIFEVKKDQQVPENKTLLQKMLAKKTAIPFHKNVCAECHAIAEAKEWREANETKDLRVFNVGKRDGKQLHWEPMYIGTHAEPYYDERLSWEGRRNKMSQGYALCALDYNFLILNNAFLVHKPGIKHYKKDPRRDKEGIKTNRLIENSILPELQILYGFKEGCDV